MNQVFIESTFIYPEFVESLLPDSSLSRATVDSRGGERRGCLGICLYDAPLALFDEMRI